MYSRYYGNQGEKIRLPENYSGCAFPRKEAVAPNRTASPPPILHEPPPIKKPPTDLPPPPCKDVEENAEEQPHVEPPVPAPSHSCPPFPFAKGLLSRLSEGDTELDTLLILGLIFLLLHDGEDTEIVLWLLLLLLC